MTGEPNKQYRQHHDVAAPQVDAQAFRQGWRVSTRLDGLLRDGLIDPGIWQAAADFRTNWERAFGMGHGASGQLSGARSVNLGRVPIELDAAARIRRVKARLGAKRLWLIECCVIHDYPWTRTAETLSVTDKTARDWTAQALAALATVAITPNRGYR